MESFSHFTEVKPNTHLSIRAHNSIHNVSQLQRLKLSTCRKKVGQVLTTNLTTVEEAYYRTSVDTSNTVALGDIKIKNNS